MDTQTILDLASLIYGCEPTEDAVTQALRDAFDPTDSEEAERQWFDQNRIDPELGDEWQDMPEWFVDDWAHICNPPCEQAARNMGKLWNSDGSEVWHHEDPERFTHVLKRIHRMVEEADKDSAMVYLDDCGGIPSNPHYGQVVDGYMIVGTLPVSGEVEITGTEGQGLGVYALHEYASLVVGVPVE